MSFPRAALRRFNESSAETPAPSDYDPKDISRAKGSFAPQQRAQRFSDTKEVTPGPGQYDPAAAAAKKSGPRTGPLKATLELPGIAAAGSDDVFRTPCWKGPLPRYN